MELNFQHGCMDKWWSGDFLEVKASKGMHQVYIEISPERHLTIHLR